MTEVNLVQQARALRDLGARLAGEGRRDEAVVATEQAVGVYRRLEEADPETFAPQLASALSNLSADLVDLERREGALTAIEEAVGIYRGLGRLALAAVAAPYARACCNLGWVALQVNDLDKALTASRESETAFRQLASADRGEFEPELSMVLTNISMILFRLDRTEEAAEAGQEAVSITRRLARDNPAARADLARALMSLSGHLLDSERIQEAMATGEEATELYRELAGTNPGMYVPAEAGALINLADVSARLERWDDAVAFDFEAAQILEPLAGEAPEVYGLRLAVALVDLTGNLTRAGDDETAMDAALRAQQVFARVPETEAERVRLEPRLAETLSAIGYRFASSGQVNQAIRAHAAVVAIYRRLTIAVPGKFDPSLATALANLGNVLCVANRPTEAEAAQRAGLEIMRGLPDTAGHESVIGLMLAGLSVSSMQAEHWEEALAATESAIEILLRYEEYAEYLAQCTHSRTVILARMGREEHPA
jgi:tetratricopeptide (TPR) repeat protein